MSIANKVLWREGMFLRPQHFQQQEAFFQSLVNSKPDLLGGLGYGFSLCLINEQLLSQGKLALVEAKGFFPDGSYFSIPNKEPAPPPLILTEEANGQLVYLAVIDAHTTNQDVGDNQEHHYRYLPEVKTLHDKTSEQALSAEIETGALNLRFMMEKEDMSHYSVLPVAKIFEVRPDKTVSLDKSFIPPVVEVGATPQLSSLCEEVHGLLHYRADVLANRLKDAQQSESAVLSDFMMLQLVNRYEAILFHLSRRVSLHPEVLYMHFIELLSQLSAFINETRRPVSIPVYNHRNLAHVFVPLMQGLRHALSQVLEQNAKSIALNEQSHGVYVSEKLPQAVFEKSIFVLGVYADASQEELKQMLPKTIKVGPVDSIRELVSRSLPGISLQALAVAPRQIPYHANYVYFQLNTQGSLWQDIVSSLQFCLHLGVQLNQLRLELWAIRH